MKALLMKLFFPTKQLPSMFEVLLPIAAADLLYKDAAGQIHSYMCGKKRAIFLLFSEVIVYILQLGQGNYLINLQIKPIQTGYFWMENKYFQGKENAVCVEFYYLCAFLFSSFFYFGVTMKLLWVETCLLLYLNCPPTSNLGENRW